MRIAIVDNEKLKNMDTKKQCVNVCPVNRDGSECITIAEDNHLIIDENLCTGCGLCVKAAPNAIKIINLPEELNTEPLHRFGENKFALYSLPTPTKGSVTGIIGVNGIGKSTAIKILAQVVKPNFGDWKTEGNFEGLVERFKGKEAQGFFEDLRDGNVTLSYKPQQVSLLSQTTMGKVGQLLERIDQRKAFKEVVDALDLGHLLDNDIRHLSGGELQRVAIAATALKQADVYIFDEPTTYLDIKQRLKMAKFLRTLSTEENSVLVIEHDLVAMDYLTDFVHIMYGKNNAFGVVSHKKSSREGINTYLSGYMRDENVRFRNYPIKFEIRPPTVSHEKHVLLNWGAMEAQLGKFRLKVSPGEFKRKTVVGVVGENGIGKSSFVKILAGEIKADTGSFDSEVSIAYKPQYVESESDELVMQYLQLAIQKHSNDIIKPLKLEPLFYSKLNELSGGELQKVEIARALSQGANLVLLDEPSAYLDVEQRLILSKVLRNLVDIKGLSLFVIDHDLVFLDYLSDELMYFEGTPGTEGTTVGPLSMEEGMNHLLKEVNITLRREEESGRPRINKEDSLKDREAKQSGNYYYQ